MKLSYGLKITFAAAVLIVIGACSSLSALVAPAAQPLEQAAVAAAVATTVIAGNASAATQAARATKIATIARQVLEIDSGASAALVDIEVIVNSKVAALGLPAQDMLLAQILTASLGQVIQAQLTVTTKGAISPQTQLAIATVCKWVIADATAYGAAP